MVSSLLGVCVCVSLWCRQSRLVLAGGRHRTFAASTATPKLRIPRSVSTQRATPAAHVESLGSVFFNISDRRAEYQMTVADFDELDADMLNVRRAPRI